MAALTAWLCPRVTLLWQALRGQPLIAPAGWTLGAATALVVAVAAAVVAILYRSCDTGSAHSVS